MQILNDKIMEVKDSADRRYATLVK